MDISIIVPCHNLENFINPLLVSLQNQVLTNIKAELIFVLDACEDKTMDKIEQFDFENYQNVMVLTCNVLSCGLARNVGMREATGDLIWFIDGDDWLLYPFAIECVIERMNEKDKPNVIKVEYNCPKYFFSKGHPSMVWQYVYRRSLIENIKFSGIQPNEDQEFNQRIGVFYGKVPKIGKPLYYYNYLRQGSNMQQFFTKGRIDP